MGDSFFKSWTGIPIKFLHPQVQRPLKVIKIKMLFKPWAYVLIVVLVGILLLGALIQTIGFGVLSAKVYKDSSSDVKLNKTQRSVAKLALTFYWIGVPIVALAFILMLALPADQKTIQK